MLVRLSCTMLFLAFSFCAVQAQLLLLDIPASIGGVEAACTGVSLDAREDPRWSQYSLKLEFAGAGGRYLGGETVTLRQEGKTIFASTCKGPWLLLRLPAGRYEVEASIGGETAKSSAIIPVTGQARVVLRFTGMAANS